MSKQPDEWDENDLIQLVKNGVDENIELEYKGADSLQKAEPRKVEIGKDVSAFANSAGGTIVYGIKESSGPPPRIPENVEGIDPSQISKEWLDQVISSRVSPRIDGLRISPIWLKVRDPGKVAYVIHVPQGTTAHQASDGRYYKRHNFTAEFMNHYEIMDVMNRVKHPRVIAEVNVYQRSPATGYDKENKVEALLSIKLENVGNRVADRVYIDSLIPRKFLTRYQVPPSAGGQTVDKNGAQFLKLAYYYRQPDGLLPLFPGVEHEMLNGNYMYLRIAMSDSDFNSGMAQNALISCTVYADNAKPETCEISVATLLSPKV